MSNHPPIYRAAIDANGAVSLQRIDPGKPGYRKASKRAILRQRDAIESYRKLKTDGKGFEGTYDFHFLDSARTFGMLHLEAREREVQDNLDRVLGYSGE